MKHLSILALSIAFLAADAQASGIAVWPGKSTKPGAEALTPTLDSQNPFETIAKLAKETQFILFSDGSHLDVESFQFFTREETLAALAAAGKQSIFVEMLNTASSENDIQTMVDMYARDTEQVPQRREQFVTALAAVFASKYLAGYESDAQKKGTTTAEISTAYASAFADLVERATKLGMRIYCADSMVFATQSPELRAFVADLQSDLPPGYSLQQAIESSPALSQEYADLALAARLNDTGLADFIRRTAGPENAVIYYGVLHGNRQGDLDDLLDKDRTRRIELHASQAAYQMHMVAGKACPDLANAVFLVKEGRFTNAMTPATVFPACETGLASPAPAP